MGELYLPYKPSFHSVKIHLAVIRLSSLACSCSSTLLVVLLLFLTTSLQAQSLSPVTINVGGGQAKNSSFSLDYSIGEQSAIVQFQSPASGSISAGVLQAILATVTGLLPPPNSEGEALVLFPNPAADYSTLKGALSKPGYLSFQLVDMRGRVLQSDSPRYYSRQVEKEFSLTELSAGLYFIRVSYSSEGITQALTFKLIKAH